ncbi:MAG TPA: acetamidase/formamidase family protein [Thermomicrobiaceae bacterium]|nr:acetamidase/formamidase family protein [Thermomicrobiaceae bacterium]
MVTHELELNRQNLHGPFSRDRPPVLTIDPGDSVRFKTLDAGWGIEPHAEDGTRRQFSPRDEEADRGHALCGPVAIRGARTGMTLGIHVDELRVGGWGWTGAGGWSTPVNDRLGVAGERTLLRWTLDPDEGIGTDQYGHEVTLRPFMGVIGMPPDEPGFHPTSPPRACGGNIDCKELVVGTTLYLPIPVDGGLVSVGDGHGAQGDGEVSGTAIECPVDRVQLTFTVHEELHLKNPRARVEGAWLTLGFDDDLDVATTRALDGMLDLIEEQFSVGRREALALASVVVDLRVSQIVNGVQGVHAVLADGAIRR